MHILKALRQFQHLATLNQNDQIEVTRRIWRGEGSEYRVNGKEVRLKLNP